MLIKAGEIPWLYYFFSRPLSALIQILNQLVYALIGKHGLQDAGIPFRFASFI